MKRFGEFIRQLSLSQQLAAIIFFLISFFTAFFFFYLTGSVENVIREQMYTTLDTSQNMIQSLYGSSDETITQSQLRKALTNSQMHLIVDVDDVINNEADPKIQYLSSETDASLVREELSNNSALVKRMMEQGAQLYKNPTNINKDYKLIIQPDDQLAIYVSSSDKELIQPFNNLTLIGQGETALRNGTNLDKTSYFVVGKDGYVDFPIFGKLKAAGKTVNEFSEDIQNRMIAEKMITDAKVTTKIMSFKVTVLGDVKTPGTKTCSGERLTLLEVLGMAGDLNNSAIRKNLLVVREEVTYTVDLTDPESVFNSPAYYMRQNDVVYVQSNRSVKIKGSSGYLYWSLLGSGVGLVTSITSLVFAITK